MIRPCSHPGCANPATYRSRCLQHARHQEASRNQTRANQRHIYNSKRWRLTRRKYLFANPLCECGQLATDVHHKTDLQDGGDPWNWNNLQGLCARCHSRITRQRQLKTRLVLIGSGQQP